MIGDVVLVDAGARSCPRTLKNIKILQQKRHAGEGTIGEPLCDLPFRIVGMLYDHRVDLRVDLGGTGDRLVQQFLGADLFFPDELGKAEPVVAAVFPKSHDDTRGEEATNSAKHSSQPSTS